MAAVKIGTLVCWWEIQTANQIENLVEVASSLNICGRPRDEVGLMYYIFCSFGLLWESFLILSCWCYINTRVSQNIGNILVYACLQHVYHATKAIQAILYGCTIWMLTKHKEKKQDENCTRMLQAIWTNPGSNISQNSS